MLKEIWDYKHSKHAVWARDWERLTGTDIESVLIVCVIVLIGMGIHWCCSRSAR